MDQEFRFATIFVGLQMMFDDIDCRCRRGSGFVMLQSGNSQLVLDC